MSCTVDGCIKASQTAGMCRMHYLRQWRHGDPSFLATTKGLPISERLSKRSVETPSGCVEWTGPKHDEMGYARIRIGGRMVYVHRAAWEIENGPIPEGLVILHSCDNPSCINVVHMSVGSQRDNVQDMLTKGRADRRGDRANPAKLTGSEVRELRDLAAQGHSRSELSKIFGISKSQVDNIRLNRHWIESEAS